MIHLIKATLFSVDAQKSTTGSIDIETWTQSERLKRALQFSAATVGMIIASIFIPIVHFILVPGLVIALPFIFQSIYQSKAVLKTGSGTCPNCQQVMTIARGPVKSPIEELCEHCRRPVKIEFEILLDS
jgi:hypothetical protein